jgi:DNA ligase-1
MSSPAKRRKKNDHNGSKQSVRGLDYFFARQKEAAKDVAGGPQDATPTQETAPESVADNGAGNGTFTDEELARKLQEEWNKEDQVQTVAQSQNNAHHAGAPISDELYENPSLDAPKTSSEGTPGSDELPKEQQKAQSSKPHTLSLQSASAAEDTVSADIPFDQSPLEFDPSKYIPDLQSRWKNEGGNATYALLTRCFVLVNSTQSRIKIVDTLVNLLRTLIQGDPDSVLPAVSIPKPYYIFNINTRDRSGSPQTPYPLLTSTLNSVLAAQPSRKL